jgi:integrase
MAHIPKCLSNEELATLFEDRPVPTEVLRRAAICGRAIVYLMLYTGLRSREVAGLTLDHIDWDKKQILIENRKTGKPLVQVLPEPVIQAIYEYVSQIRPNGRTERSLFFKTRPPILPMATSAVRCSVVAYFEPRKIEGGPHRLRHTHGQLLLETGSSINQVQASLGHSREESTQIYSKTSMARMRRYIIGDSS